MTTQDSKVVFVVSDSSGETASRAIKAALELYKDAKVTEQRYPEVRTVREIQEIVHRASELGSLVLYTLADDSHRQALEHVATKCGVKTVDLFRELIPNLSEWLHAKPSEKPSHKEDLEKLRAMDFFRTHEDGQNPEGLKNAEIIVIGLSRVTKTPVCMRLADHGYLAANIPLTLQTQPPRQLFEVATKRIFVLTMRPARLLQYRRSRLSHLGVGDDNPYVNERMIAQEVRMIDELMQSHPEWHKIDVTNRQSEETAGEIMRIYQSHFGGAQIGSA